MATPFSAPQIGSVESIGQRFAGGVAGVGHDVVFPESKLVKDQFLPGRPLTWKFRADKHRWISLRDSRLMVKYEFKFGEVPITAADVTTGPQNGKCARPANHLRMQACPGAALFDSQVRFSANNVQIEQSNSFYAQTCLQLATTTNLAGGDTSGSGMLTTLRKDPGQAFGGHFDGCDRSGAAERAVGVRAAPYVLATAGADAGKTKALDGDKSVRFVSDAIHTGPYQVATVGTTAATQKVITIAARDFNVLRPGLKVRYSDASSLCTAASDSIIVSADDVANTITLKGAIVTEIPVDTVLLIGDAGELGINSLTVNELASAFQVDVPPTSAKSTTTNPKFAALQMGWDDGKKTSTVEIAEPLVGLQSWNSKFCSGPGEYELSATISPDWQKNIVFDPLGQYTCVEGNGGCMNSEPKADGTGVMARQIYCSIQSVSLLINYLNPVSPYVPKSISLRWQPIQVARVLLTDQTVNETVTVGPATRAVVICLRDRHAHVCADAEEISLGGAGITSKGAAKASTGTAPQLIAGEWEPFNKGYGYTDAKEPEYRVEPWQSLQVQYGNAIEPREMYANLDPLTGQMARPWSDYTNYIAKYHGYRGSMKSIAQYCGHESFFRKCGPRAGDTGGFIPFVLRTPGGSLNTALNIRGQLVGPPGTSSGQEMLVFSISDELWNTMYDPTGNSEVPLMTKTNVLS